MRSFGLRLTFLVAILWTGIGSTVWALGHHGDAIETVYVMPSSATLPVPTSYVVSTSWVEPTAYAVPTYYTTAYWMDPVVLAQPAYAETAYVRRAGLFGRRWVVERPVLATYATSYVPTTYTATSYIPTTYSATSYVPTSCYATSYVPTSCYATSYAPTVYSAAPVVAWASPTYTLPPRYTGAATAGKGSRPRVRQSEPDERGSVPSDVPPAPQDLNPVEDRGAAGEAGRPATAPGTLPPDLSPRIRDTSPPPPAAQRPQAPAARPESAAPRGQANPSGTGTQGGTSGQQPSGGGGTAQPGAAQPGRTGQPAGAAASPTAPTAPGEADSNAPPPIGPPGEIRRESMRPSYSATQGVSPSLRSILVGTVLSDAEREPEEGVRIRVRNLDTGSGKDTTTNAFGRFAVKLADGDWAVDVTTRSGRVYEVSQIRVNNGVVTDSLGRRVPSLEITR
jgi:hypothetical protein